LETAAWVAEVNVRHIWDVVSQIKLGAHGHAYVVEGQGDESPTQILA